MNTVSSLFNWIGNTIGANPNTLTTTSKKLVGAINEVDAKAKVITISTVNNATVNSGYYTMGYPAGHSYGDTVIIQPTYDSGALIGWTACAQTQANVVNIYVRQGASLPADNSKICFKAIFIKA